MFKKLLGVISAFLLVAFVAVAVYTAVNFISGPASKPISAVVQRMTGEKADFLVKPYTKMQKTYTYKGCGDVEEYYRGPVPYDLVGLDYSRLKMKYPPAQGWDVSQNGEEIIINRQVDGFCGMHKEYRHLGVYDGMLAVYQGPLGDNSVLLRLERNIDLKTLPQAFQEKLDQVNQYDSLSEEVKTELQKNLEFPDEQSLNSMLENFDELVATYRTGVAPRYAVVLPFSGEWN